MEYKSQLFEIIEKEAGDRAAFLRKLFKNIPEEIVREMTYAEVKKGEHIISAGNVCESVYFILNGNVIGVDYHQKGRMYSFMDFSKMYIIGDFELFTEDSESMISIKATEKCTLFKLSTSSYLRWIQHDENAMFLHLSTVLKTLSNERKLDREYLLMGGKDRLVNFLLRLYEKDSKSKNIKLKVEMTQAQLADKTGVNTRSVQRNIAALEDKGLLTVEAGKITISYEQYLLLKEHECTSKISE